MVTLLLGDRAQYGEIISGLRNTKHRFICRARWTSDVVNAVSFRNNSHCFLYTKYTYIYAFVNTNNLMFIT